MSNLEKTLALICSSFSLLSGCGGGDGGGSSAPSSPAVQTQFTDITAPTGFEWRSSENRQVTIKVVSNYSVQQGEAMPIRGQHVVSLFSVIDDVVDATPLFTGLTENSGELSYAIELSGHWQAIQAVSTVREIECVSSTEISAMDNVIALGCDIALESD
ncbi:TPA: hypothetical protein RQJ75_002709 [Vibrio vulnificus]|uniref:hypothetical protein n=1 Tax=Vibrio vulnificus TaxID=672 RepID=UPI0005F1E1D3|nr:hypothetical protein [Vibrio vulnificus]EHZ7342748.1 hypothetical protein [Vibrio vulnificus]ELH3007130.1 hypothetical protein [Vibrio vulnificus]ELK8327094.1 hypothetical protein [Vibrio vulnificus]ELN6896780.1 hypothetical protein [Vibrio vulnificus]ELU0081587.1 hypothetical protein [Vibrio vulnificus]